MKEVIDMGFLKKLFRTENVYAGPEPKTVKKGKEEFEMVDVYAGPEEMEMRLGYDNNQAAYPFNNSAKNKQKSAGRRKKK